MTGVILLGTGLTVSVWTALELQKDVIPDSIFTHGAPARGRYLVLWLVGMFTTMQGSNAVFARTSFYVGGLTGALMWIAAMTLPVWVRNFLAMRQQAYTDAQSASQGASPRKSRSAID